MDAKLAKFPLDRQTDLANTHCEDKPANRKEYLSMVGSLMYAALRSRSDIAFSVTALSQYNVQPLEMHTTAAKRVLQYLKTTVGFRIHYRQLLNPTTIVGYTDSNWAGNLTTRKSIGRCVFGLGNINVNNELVISGLIHWQAKSQSVVALSTLDAEYIACLHATQESLWLKHMMKEATGGMAVKIVDGPVPIGCDNQGAVKFQYVTSESNPADLMMKPLAVPRHERLLQLTRITLFGPDDGEPKYDE